MSSNSIDELSLPFFMLILENSPNKIDISDSLNVNS